MSSSDNAYVSRHNFNDFNLAAFSRRSTVRALLLPESLSAKYSTCLVENKAKIAHIAPLPSLSKASKHESTRVSSGKVPGDTAQAEKKTNGSQIVIVLEQSQVDEKFRFVSSSNIRGNNTCNNVVLKHPNSENQDVCYINLIHVEFYPDPDCGALILCNTSTSTFTSHSLLVPQSERIKPGRQATLDGSTWQLTLGKGLTFQIKVLPHAPSNLYHGCLRVSFGGLALRPRLSESSASAVSTKVDPILRPSTVSTSKVRVLEDKLALKERLRFDTGESSPGPPPEPLAGPIGKTAFTTVFKTVRNNTTLAIKMCRKPALKMSADMWRNELNLLTQLDHVKYTFKFLFIKLSGQ